MSEPFLAEIRMFGFSFAPRGWAFCNGQILPIDQNQSLYSLIGTTYGGDGRTTFALPDLRGRVPISPDSSTPQGAAGGTETVTLTEAELPVHSHVLNARDVAGDAPVPSNAASLGGYAGGYGTSADTPMDATAIGATGGGQSHDNVQPSLAVSFCIAMQGLFPPRN